MPFFSDEYFLLYCDGATRHNQHAQIRQSGYGCLLYDPSGRQIANCKRYIGNRTNNEAEYEALIAGLELALRNRSHDIYRLRIRMDSSLVVNQVRSQYETHSSRLVPLLREVDYLLTQFDDWSIKAIPREHNAPADRLANLAIDEHQARQRRQQQYLYY